MKPSEFNEVFAYILKHYDTCRCTRNCSEYCGKYKGKLIRIKMSDSGISRRIYVDGYKYYTTYVGGSLAIGVMRM